MKKFFKTFKEEIISILLLLIGFYVINFLLTKLFPNSAFFDFPSVIETILFSCVRFIIVLSLAWIGVRIIFPNVYRFIKNEFYEGFPELDNKMKYILGTSIFIAFILASSISANAQNNIREDLLNNLQEHLDVREITNNSSPEIDMYLLSVGFDYPVAWCAAFVSWHLSNINVNNPNSAWSPSFARDKDVIWYSKTGYKNKNDIAKCGDVVTFYYSNLKRVGHVGFFIKQDKNGYFITIEGNTNNNGSRTGDGVYMKKRDPKKVHAVSRYIKTA